MDLNAVHGGAPASFNCHLAPVGTRRSVFGDGHPGEGIAGTERAPTLFPFARHRRRRPGPATHGRSLAQAYLQEIQQPRTTNPMRTETVTQAMQDFLEIRLGKASSMS